MKKGQTTVEYILLVIAVVLVLIVFLNPTGNGVFQNQVVGVLNRTVIQINSMVNSINLL